jgi:hypothetical protein
MLCPATLTTRYFLRMMTTNSMTSAKHTTVTSHQLIPAVTY